MLEGRRTKKKKMEGQKGRRNLGGKKEKKKGKVGKRNRKGKEGRKKE